MKPKHYSCHPICLLFPRMTEEELRELADDIRIKGLLHPIVLYEEKILDGRNRYLACPIAGVEPRFVEWQGEGSPLQWVISENMVRRHLTSSQRAVLALELLPLLEQEAKQRQRQGARLAKKFAKLPDNSKASEVAARLPHSNSRYVEAAKTIQSQAPELVEKIRTGILKIPDATRLARLPKAERKGILRLCNGRPLTAAELRDLTRKVKSDVRQRAAKAFAKSSGSSSNILIGDLDLLWKRLEDDSVDLFLSDPPYTQIDLYERLAELAAAKLKSGGLCLAHAGAVSNLNRNR